MKFARWLTLGVALLFSFGLISSNALTQGQQVTVTLTFTNICEDTLLTLTQIVLQSGLSLHISVERIELPPGQSYELTRELSFTPRTLTVVGFVDREEFKVTFDPLIYNQPFRDQGEARGCLQIFATLSGGETPPPTAPPTEAKPIVPGQNLNQVLATLQARGMSVRQEGSQSNPKLGDVSDPMLLRAISGFSAQLLWVSAPGTLRSVITWDNPSVDLDLIVFGFPFGFCFQLNPAGILAETCDRAPFGPVSGTVFAVLVINWSPLPQAYVLSLSP
jgi:hypothetical protein